MRKVIGVGLVLSGLPLLGCSADISFSDDGANVSTSGGGANAPGAGGTAGPGSSGPEGSASVPGGSGPGSPVSMNPGGAPSCSETAQLLPPRMIRLSHAELRQHIQAALPGVPADLLKNVKFQADHVTTASARGMSGAEFGIYFSAAKNVANAYVADSAELADCRATALDASCLSALNHAIERLYRRPVEAAEREQFRGTFERVSKAQGAKEAATALITGALIAPQTQYHTEAGDAPNQSGVYRLTQHETLQLARYALTGKSPSEEELGLLGRTPEEFDRGLSEFAARWVSTPDFIERMVDLSEHIFGVQYLPAVQREEESFTPAVQSAMVAQFRGFVREKVLSPGGNFADLFLQNPAQVMPELEAIYKDDKLSPSGESPRLGVLGLPGLLVTLSGPNGSDPVMRGLLVRELLLCETLPPPVPDADFSLVKVTEDMQTRERFDMLAQTQPCASCHQTINPPGYLFENFDHLGRYRIEEKGRPVNAVSTITPPFRGGPYEGVGEWNGIVPLAKWLARSPEARRCFATNFASFVLSDTVPYKVENCNMKAVASRFVETGQVADLVADVVRSPLFTHRTREVMQ